MRPEKRHEGKLIPPKRLVWGQIRKKWLVFQPEESVRQVVLHFLVHEMGYASGRIQVERKVHLNEINQRCDILIFDKQGQPFLLVECKAPSIEISNESFLQLARYNLKLKVPYLLATNGHSTYCCKMQYDQEPPFQFLESIPNPDE